MRVVALVCMCGIRILTGAGSTEVEVINVLLSTFVVLSLCTHAALIRTEVKHMLRSIRESKQQESVWQRRARRSTM